MKASPTNISSPATATATATATADADNGKHPTPSAIHKKDNSSSNAAPPPRGGSFSTSSLAHDITRQGERSIELQKKLITSVNEIGQEIHNLSKGEIAAETYERMQKIRRLDRLSSERYIALKDLKADWTNSEEKDLAKTRLEELDTLRVKLRAELKTAAGN